MQKGLESLSHSMITLDQPLEPSFINNVSVSNVLLTNYDKIGDYHQISVVDPVYYL